MSMSSRSARLSTQVVAEPTVVESDAERAAAAEPARLVVVRGSSAGRAIPIGGDETTLGRATCNDVVLADISVSRRHALLRRMPAGYVLVDRDSGNGTRLNGSSVRAARLRNGDEIALGDAVVQFVEAGRIAARGGTTTGNGLQEVLRAVAGVGSLRRAVVGCAVLVLVAGGMGIRELKQRHGASSRGVASGMVAGRAPSSEIAPPAAAEVAPVVAVPAAAVRAEEVPKSDAANAAARAEETPKSSAANAAAQAPGRREGVARDRAVQGGRIVRGVAPARVADRSGIASAASHVGAPRYDARDDRVRKDWQRVEAEANEAYLRGYVTKDIDEEAAREAFRTVLAALPATHPTAVKAQRWLLRLDGKVAEED